MKQANFPNFSEYLNAKSHHEVDDLVKRLFKVVRDLRRDNMFYCDIEQHLSFSGSNVSQFDISDQPILTDLSNSGNFYAVTITFDPNRFENLDVITEESQQKYILTKLYDFLSKGYNVTELYGSFELHQSGVVHSHLLIGIYDWKQLYDFLLRQFSKTRRNKHCILIKPIDDMKKWIEYINKAESYEKQYYRLKQNDPNSLDL